MSRLPAPPQFNLPPPPMPPSDIFDVKIISQLTCSSIRQQQQWQQTILNSRLILFTSACVITAILLLLITIICLLLSRKSKKSNIKHNSKPSIPINSINDLTICSNRSYETVSSDRTGAYLESIDTSATTCSIDTTDGIYIEYYHPYVFQSPAPYYHIVNIPDIVPN